jgi:tRNA A-37 threonylcarbamoyl transferase component Bud32
MIIVIINLRYQNIKIFEKYIHNIFNQSIKPYIIHIFYSDDRILNEFKIDKDIEIKISKISNIKIKVVPALKYYKDDILISLEDNIKYENNFIENMIQFYKKKKCIICSLSKVYDFNEYIDLDYFHDLSYVYNKKLIKPFYSLIPIDNGILYHTNMFDNDIINLNYDKLNENILNNFNLYLRYYTFNKNIKVHSYDNIYFYSKKINIEIILDIKKLTNINNKENDILEIVQIIKNEKKIYFGPDIKTLQYDNNNKINDKEINLIDILSDKFFSKKYIDTNILMINLEKDINRYYSCIEEFKKISIEKFCHIKGTYWKNKKQMNLDLNDILSFLNNFYDYDIKNDVIINDFSETSDKNIKIQGGPLGCYCSHLRAMISGYNQFTDYTIICEDDIAINNTKNIEKYINEIPDDWDIIFLNSAPLNKKYDKIMYKFSDLFHSAHFYIIKNKCFPKLFKHMYPITNQVDILISELYNILNIYNIEDTVTQKNFFTNTQNNIYTLLNQLNYNYIKNNINDIKNFYINTLNNELKDNKYNENICNNIILDHIYHKICNFNKTDNEIDKIIYKLNDVSHIYQLIYNIFNTSIKGYNINNIILSVINGINNIIINYNLHNTIDYDLKQNLKSYSYGSSSNIYITENKKYIIKQFCNLKWKSKNHDDISKIYIKELLILKNLKEISNTPNLLFNDDKNLILKMDYLGISLHEEFILPEDWKEQLFIIFKKLSDNNIYYPEFNIKNIVVLNKKISFIDFGLSELNSNKNNDNNYNIFVILLEILKDKFKNIKDIEEQNILYLTFINNMKDSQEYANNIF